MLIKTSMSVCLLKKGIGKLWKEVEGEKDRVEDDKISSFVFVDLLVVMQVFSFVQIVDLLIFLEYSFFFLKK